MLHNGPLELLDDDSLSTDELRQMCVTLLTWMIKHRDDTDMEKVLAHCGAYTYLQRLQGLIATREKEEAIKDQPSQETRS